MDPRTNTSSLRLRQDGSDLIDLTELDDRKLSNHLVNLFDPLGHPTIQPNRRTESNERSRPVNRSIPSIGLRRKDRRFRATSACPTLISANPKDSVPGSIQKESPEIINSCLQTELSSLNGESPSESDNTTAINNGNHTRGISSKSLHPNDTTHHRYHSESDTGPKNSRHKTNLDEAFSKPTEVSDNKLRLVRKHQRSSREVILITQKIKLFRAKFKHNDSKTNSGLVYSPTLYSSKVRDMSVKITISSPMAINPINFTCNVSTTIEHLISHAVCSMFECLREDDTMGNYILKVTGKDEYFDSNLCLADYALVTHCWKFDLDVKLTLVRADSAKRPFIRTPKDDFRCKSLLCPDDIIARKTVLKFSDLNYENLNISIETFEREAQRLYSDVTNRSTTLQTQSLLQTTKAICSQMMNCETSLLSEAKDNVAELCHSYKSEGSNLADEDRYKMIEVIQHAIKRLVENMRRLLRLTSTSLPVDYEVVESSNSDINSQSRFVDTPVSMLKESVSLRVHLVSQLKPDWLARYQEFHLDLRIAHGSQIICGPVSSSVIKVDKSFFQRLLFDEEIILPITYSKLPREARLLLTLYGTQLELVNFGNQLNPNDDSQFPLRRTHSSASVCSTAPMCKTGSKLDLSNKNQHLTTDPVDVALAHSVSYFFDSDLMLHQGDKLIYMHPISAIRNDDIYIESIFDRNDPILVIEFRRFPLEKRIHFPFDRTHGINQDELCHPEAKDFDSLDPGVKYVLGTIIYDKQQHELLMDDEKTLIWDNRLHLTKIPEALPKMLRSVPSWSATDLAHIYSLLRVWAPLNAIDALQLLLPSYPDSFVRKTVVDWISGQSDDELCDYLPQLLQAFRYEKTLDCPLFWLLMERALKNVRIANSLYWQLKLNSNDPILEERSETLINCLLHTCGAAFWQTIDKQNELLQKLTTVSNDIKKVRDGLRTSLLLRKLENFQDYLMDKKPTMPWAPSIEVCDLDLKSCTYFPSNTLPLKLSFRSCEETCRKQIKFYSYETIFKMGDDLRQDMLAIQMIRIMEKLWLREGLDLRMVTFDCLATGDRQGMVEVVQNAETLRKIHQNSRLIMGPFNSKAIDSYIRLWNTSELEYKTAMDNFLHSCAGYSVATYILGICDRHNDNIMITSAGHLFHIDFGKFLGDSQMMGNIKRDRTPFVLTADMAYVINGGDRPSKKFQTFIELCTMGFNIIRRNRNLFLNLFSLMASANINGLDRKSVKYIDKMLMPNLSETEAMARFTRLIEECLNSCYTQLNFFIHSLAQLRFSNDSTKQSLLSFVPKTFTIETDGEIESLEVVSYYKLYEPEKQYYYVVNVKRFNQPDVTKVTRTFREFSELQIKLNGMFPSHNFHDINKSTSSFLMDFVGRNNTREIAERRLIELKIFLKKLLTLPEGIKNCDLIYTFFHPILRDQQASNQGDLSILNESSSTFGSQEYGEAQRNALYLGSNGQVKLSLSYKNGSLIIMVMHAKNLAQLEGSINPNCYAKTYLLPDPLKQTKRKTRIVRQNCNPSFMELVVYRLPKEALKGLTLQVSIWHSELVQYKACMGAALISLEQIDWSKETTSWYPLKSF